MEDRFSVQQATTAARSAVQARTLLHRLSLFSRNQKGERRLSPPRYKFFLAAHIAVSGAWLGASAVKMVLAIAASTAAAHPVSSALLTAISVLTSTDVTLAILTALTGLVLSFGTKWGVIQHYWIVTKIFLTISVVLTAAVFTDEFLLPLDAVLVRQTSSERTLWSLASSGSILLITLCAADMLMIALGAFLSVYKPWGKTPLGRRTPKTDKSALPQARAAKEASASQEG